MPDFQIRLTQNERQAIIQTILSYDANASIYLYGSRCNPSKKGGDIDIAILSSKIDRSVISKIRLRLFDLIGDQKIDIISGDLADSAFLKMAIETGILLNEK